MMDGMTLAILGLAAGKRSENTSPKALSHKMMETLPHVVLPGFMAERKGVGAAYFLCDNQVPAKRTHWVCYPELNALEEAYSHTNQPVEAWKYICEESNLELFASKNLMHSHFQTLHDVFVVRNCLSRFMSDRISLRRDRNIIKLNPNIISCEQMEEEINLFLMAVQVVAEATIKKWYGLDMASFRAYYYKVIQGEENTPLTKAMLQVLLPPEKPGSNLSKDELGLDGLDSLIFGDNLVEDASHFIYLALRELKAVN